MKHIVGVQPVDVEFLSDYSSRDARWDASRKASQVISKYYYDGGNTAYAARVNRCSTRLGFVALPDSNGVISYKLRSVYLCHVRHCAVCQRARTWVWKKRFYEGLPNLITAYPTVRFIFLTLTVKNCKIWQLREVLKHMAESFHRLVNRKNLKRVILGYAKSLEITKSAEHDAHPHYHLMIAVKSTYFNGNSYINQSQWAQMWKECLQVDYTPIVDIRKVRSKKANKLENPIDRALAGVRETAKYTVKVSDLVGTGKNEDVVWLIQLTEQLHGVKQINLSGIFREFIKQGEPTEEEILEGEGETIEDDELLFFSWFPSFNKYARYKIKKD